MLIDCHNHVGADLLFYLHGDFPYAQHLVAMHDQGRDLGVSHWIVFPFVMHAALALSTFMTTGEIREGAGRLQDVPLFFWNVKRSSFHFLTVVVSSVPLPSTTCARCFLCASRSKSLPAS